MTDVTKESIPEPQRELEIGVEDGSPPSEGVPPSKNHTNAGQPREEPYMELLPKVLESIQQTHAKLIERIDKLEQMDNTSRRTDHTPRRSASRSRRSASGLSSRPSRSVSKPSRSGSRRSRSGSGRPYSRSRRSYSRPRRSYSRPRHSYSGSRRSRSRSPLGSSRKHFSRSPSRSIPHRRSRKGSPQRQNSRYKGKIVSRRRLRNSRKHSSSPSYSESNNERTDSEYSEENSDQSERNLSQNSSRKRKRSSSTSDDSFLYNGELYRKFNKRKHFHLEGQTSRLMWNDDIISVKWYPKNDTKAFCPVIETDSASSPYMTKRLANKSLSDNFNLIPWVGENPGHKRQGFSIPFNPSAGLGQTIGVVDRVEEILTHAVVAGDKKAAMKAFPDLAFEAPAIAIFSGWPKGDYFPWANGDLLDAKQVARAFKVENVSVSPDLLIEERDTRALLVNNLTGLRALELLSDKFKDDMSNQSATLAIARLFIINLKPLIVNWMFSKMMVRKSILHNQKGSTARVLLESTLWDPLIFPKAALEEAKNTKNNSGINNLLNLSDTGMLVKQYPKPGYNQGRPKQNDYRNSSKGHYNNDRSGRKNNRSSNKSDSDYNQKKKSKGFFEMSGGKKEYLQNNASQAKTPRQKGNNSLKGDKTKNGSSSK